MRGSNLLAMVSNPHFSSLVCCVAAIIRPGCRPPRRTARVRLRGPRSQALPGRPLRRLATTSDEKSGLTGRKYRPDLMCGIYVKGCRRGFSIPHTNCGVAVNGSFHNPFLPMVASRKCWKKRGDRDRARRLRVRSDGCLVKQRARWVILRYAEVLWVRASASG